MSARQEIALIGSDCELFFPVGLSLISNSTFVGKNSQRLGSAGHHSIHCTLHF